MSSVRFFGAQKSPAMGVFLCDNLMMLLSEGLTITSGEFKVQGAWRLQTQEGPYQLPFFGSFSSKNQWLPLPKLPSQPQAASHLSWFTMFPWPLTS